MMSTVYQILSQTRQGTGYNDFQPLFFTVFYCHERLYCPQVVFHSRTTFMGKILTAFYVALLALLAPKGPRLRIKKWHFIVKFSREFASNSALYEIISMPGCNNSALYGNKSMSYRNNSALYEIISLSYRNNSTPHRAYSFAEVIIVRGATKMNNGATKMNNGATKANSGATKMNTLRGSLVQVVQVVQVKKLIRIRCPIRCRDENQPRASIGCHLENQPRAYRHPFHRV